MIVLDASAAVEWLIQSAGGGLVEQRIYSRKETLHAPHLLDIEVIQVLRRLTSQELISGRRADDAIQDLQDLRIVRYPHFILLPRVWQLRHNLPAYDAVYVALAERLGATLVTGDRRLAATSGHTATIEFF